MINTQDFWKITFNELDKTSDKEWKKFVKKHDRKQKKKNEKKRTNFRNIPLK